MKWRPTDGAPPASPTSKPQEDPLFFFTDAPYLHEEVAIEALEAAAAPSDGSMQEGAHCPLDSGTPYVRLAGVGSYQAVAKQLKVLTMRIEDWSRFKPFNTSQDFKINFFFFFKLVLPV